MATNNGTRLEVFGLSFREHHTLHMQQILHRHHKLLAASGAPLNRVALFTGLFDLAQELDEHEAQRIKDWLQNGGDFPAPIKAPVAIPEVDDETMTTSVDESGSGDHETWNESEEDDGDPMDEDADDAGDGEGEWPEYNLDDFGDIGRVDQPQVEERPPATDQFSAPQEELLNRVGDVQGNQDMGGPVTREDFRRNRGRRGYQGAPGRTLSGATPLFGQNRDIVLGNRQRDRGPGHYGGHDFGPGRTLSGVAPDMDEDLAPRTRNGRSPRGGRTLSDAPAPFLSDEEGEDDDDNVDDEPPDEYFASNSGVYQGRGHTLSEIVPSGSSEALAWRSDQGDRLQDHTILRSPSRVHENEHYEGDLELGLTNTFPASPRFHTDPHEHADLEVSLGNSSLNPARIHSNYEERVAGTSSEQPENPNSDPTEIECGICAESLPASAFPPNRKVTKNCEGHSSQACYPCIEHSIQSTLDEGSMHRLTCLFCHEKMSYEEIRKYATKSAFARYEYLVLLDSPDIVMCLRPTCNAGQKHTNIDNAKMVCNTCSYATCVLHKLPWHEGITCAEYDISEQQIDRLDAAEATAKLLAKEQSKVCPNCHQGVFRTDGCDHLLCRCGKEWCFLCLASWENIMRIGPTAHAVTCANHPHKVRPTAAQEERNQNALNTLTFGGHASAELLAARNARNQRIIADARGRSLAAAEKRLAKQKENAKKEGRDGKLTVEIPAKKRKANLKPAWEEGGWTKKSL